jgi:hypothetical protein
MGALQQKLKTAAVIENAAPATAPPVVVQAAPVQPPVQPVQLPAKPKTKDEIAAERREQRRREREKEAVVTYSCDEIHPPLPVDKSVVEAVVYDPIHVDAAVSLIYSLLCGHHNAGSS